MAALDVDTLLNVELVDCQFAEPARYFVTLQATLPGVTDPAVERTEISAASDRPVFTSSSFEFRLPVGLALDPGAPSGELLLRAVVPEVDNSAEAEQPPKATPRVVGSAFVPLAEAVLAVQQSEDREVMRELPLAASDGGASPGTLQVRLRLSPAPGAQRILPPAAETRQQAAGIRSDAVSTDVELAHKQALIDRLLDDVDKRANAVTRCGQEIMELRALNRHLEQELQAQRQASAERERAMERLAGDAANVANIDLPELQRRHRMLAAAYRSDRRRVEQLQALNSQYATSLATQEQLQSAYATLKEAHKQQAGQMLRLQDEARKVGKYRATLKQQEQIIDRLEQLMARAVSDAKLAKAQAPEIIALKGQLAQAQEELGKHRDMPSSVTEEQVKLLMRAEKSERRAAAVEEEMTEMARRSAREIAALKLKLAEKEAQLMGGFGSSANLVLGELPGGAEGGGDDFGLGGFGGGGLGGSAAPSRDVSVRSLRLPPRAPASARRLSPRLDPLASAEAGGGGGDGGGGGGAAPAPAAA